MCIKVSKRERDVCIKVSKSERERDVCQSESMRCALK